MTKLLSTHVVDSSAVLSSFHKTINECTEINKRKVSVPGYKKKQRVKCRVIQPMLADQQKACLRCFDARYFFKVRYTTKEGYPIKQRMCSVRVNRLFFLLHPQFFNSEYVVSHLCHNPDCVSSEHLVLEKGCMQLARLGCPGGSFCRHPRLCLVPGPLSNANSDGEVVIEDLN